MTTMNKIPRTLVLIGAVTLLTVVLWPGHALSVFQQGQDPIIEEGWAQTSAAGAESGECPSSQEVCVEWCRLIDGQPMPITGALCCVSTAKFPDNNFGDCLRRVD